MDSSRCPTQSTRTEKTAVKKREGDHFFGMKLSSFIFFIFFYLSFVGLLGVTAERNEVSFKIPYHNLSLIQMSSSLEMGSKMEKLDLERKMLS